MRRKLILNSLLMLLKINLGYLKLFYWAAFENIRFEIYLCFIWIQTYRTFYFSRKLFAKHYTLSSWCRIFSSRSRSREIRIKPISKFLFIVVIFMSILRKIAFGQTSIHSQSVLRWMKNIGMVSEKLYRNDLKKAL